MDIKSRMIVPTELTASDCWLPALFCGQAGRVARLASHSRKIGDAAKCLEGWRVSPDPNSPLHDPLSDVSPQYRQTNIGVFYLSIQASHVSRPLVEGRPYCVVPGDVVLPRIPPLRAALVSENNHRHPVDGNCFLARGLKSGDSGWLLTLLNEKEYEAWFVAHSSSQTLPRIGLRDLRNCPFPDSPEGASEWTRRLHDWVDRLTMNATALFALQADVSEAVAVHISGYDDEKRRLFPGVSEPAVLLTTESWLPEHVEGEYRQQILARQGWPRLGDMMAKSAPASSRLKDLPASRLPFLMLKDVSDLFLPSVEPTLPETRLGRFFSESVRSGEVLFSSLVTSPKAAYADPSFEGEVYPVDHWLRLSFRETQGAWALILSAPAMATQIRQLAMGSARQFTTKDRLMELRVPDIDRALRKQWQNRLDDLLGARRRLETEWRSLRLEGRRMVGDVLNIPWSEMKERSLR